MIKINLLPHKRLKPVDRETIRLRSAVVGLGVLVFLVLGYTFYSLAAKKSELNTRLDETQKQLNSLKQKIKVVEDFEKSRKELQTRLDIINSLEKKKVPMTLLLSELNASITRDVWFTSLKTTGPLFTVEGMARGGRKGVDAYFQRVKTDPAFTDVKLDDSKESPAQGAGVFVFKISGRLAGFDVPPPQQQAPQAGKPGAKPATPAPAAKPATPAGKK